MPLIAVAIVCAGLVGVGAVGVVEALFGVRRDARGAAAADVARVVVRADRCGGVRVADDGAAAVGSAGITGLPGAIVELLAAAADVRLIKEALKGPLSRAEVLTAAGLTAGVAITAALFRTIRTELDRISPAGGSSGPESKAGPVSTTPASGSPASTDASG